MFSSSMDLFLPHDGKIFYKHMRVLEKSSDPDKIFEIVKMWSGKSIILMQVAAKNKHTSSDCLDLIYEENKYIKSVCLNIFKNPNTSEQIITRILKSDSCIDIASAFDDLGKDTLKTIMVKCIRDLSIHNSSAIMNQNNISESEKSQFMLNYFCHRIIHDIL